MYLLLLIVFFLYLPNETNNHTASYSISLEREETSQGTRRAIQQIYDLTEEQIRHMNKCSAFQKTSNLILQKRAISPSRLTGTPWGILENILLRHALVDNIIVLLGFDLTFSFFLFFWFLVLICENEHLSQKQDLGYWGICLFQALFPNLVSVGITHCSWYSRGLILGPSFSDVGQRPHSVSLHRKSILEDLLLSLVRIQGSGRHTDFFPLSSIALGPASRFWHWLASENTVLLMDRQDWASAKDAWWTFNSEFTSGTC